MKKFLLYPLNVVLALVFALAFSLFDLSSFYDMPSFWDILVIALMCLIYIFQYSFFKRNVFFDIKNNNSKIYKKYLVFGLLGFFVEFLFYGVPVLNSSGGRDDYAGIPVFHVVFYSCMFVAILFSSLYSSRKDLVVTGLSVLVVGVLLLSRQMLMISFLIIIISSLVRYNFSAKLLIKTCFFLLGIIFLFGLVGNYRQKLSGDYVDEYIILIGGANKKGEFLGGVLYWFWLYIASPMYNFFLNVDSYYQYGEKCNTSLEYGSCSGDFLSSILFPDTLRKYLGFEEFLVDLKISYLNVGTGYAAAARILGMPGVVVQIIMQGFFYFLGYKIMSNNIKSAFIVYFSVLSIFMLFSNVFLRAECFFVFIILYLEKYKLVWKS
ncbi:hypothetical protein ACG9H2_15560 [Acinetobacter ursingii]|uniref:hypothetical protein n=1 Tax=Acinetobacter ursingii TaxID=108980 RepID=UPI003AF7FD72